MSIYTAPEHLYNYHIDDMYIKKFFPNKEAMVYGFDHCLYSEVAEALEDKGVKIYDHSLGDNLDPADNQRINGKKIYQINAGLNDNLTIRELISHTCKAGIVNMVFENFADRNYQANRVPIIFCIDITGNLFPLTSENVLSRTKMIKGAEGKTYQASDAITHHEIRRAYKLCYDENIHPKIRRIARTTFKFIRVEVTARSTIEVPTKDLKVENCVFKSEKIRITDLDLGLSLIKAPWEAKDWGLHWSARMSLKKPVSKNRSHDWRRETYDCVFRQSQYDALNSPAAHFLAKL